MPVSFLDVPRWACQSSWCELVNPLEGVACSDAGFRGAHDGLAVGGPTSQPPHACYVS